MHLAALALALVRLPGGLLKWRSGRYFFEAHGWQNLHLGKFDSFEEASAFAIEHGACARYCIDHHEWAQAQGTIRAHDYPVMYWLGRLLERDGVLFDLGGSVGVCYYAYRTRLQLPQGLSWIVGELPEVVALGTELAARRHATGLSFTTEHSVMDGCDVLLAAGVLPFLEQPLSELLAGLARRPRHILLNRLPLSANIPGYFTLQNTGHSVVPMRIEQHAHFIGEMTRAGYEVADTWKCFENSLHIPQHPECTLRHFHGFCFRLREPAH